MQGIEVHDNQHHGDAISKIRTEKLYRTNYLVISKNIQGGRKGEEKAYGLIL